MKHFQISLISFIFLLSTFYLSAQVPQKFNYQGIARDTKGNPMAQQRMTLKLTVLPTADATTGEYEEIQTVTTNEFGLYTLQIGNGTPLTGEMKAVKWETGNKYIKVAIDPKGGNDFVDAGTSQLLSVPYAIYADKAGVAKTTGGDRTGAVNSNATHVAGDANYLTKFTGLNVIGKSQLYDNGTNVGIGTASPLYKLHVQKPSGNADLLINTLDTVGAASLRLRNSTGAELGINKFGPNATGTFMGIPRANMAAVNNFTTGPFVFNSGSDIVFGNTVGATQLPRMFVKGSTGNVGIGTSAPSAKLDINGQVKIQGGSPGIGKVLTSDAAGLATWQIPSGGGGLWVANGNKIFNSNNGAVGIGTANPLALLHVSDSSVVFSGPSSLPQTPGNTPLSGPGNRFMWYADKAALRVGGVSSNEWDKDSVGNYSIAIGENTKAVGLHSISMGNTNEASGDGTVVMGGEGNSLKKGSYNSAILGGYGNSVYGDVNQWPTPSQWSSTSAIIGGYSNSISGSSSSIILGGNYNSIVGQVSNPSWLVNSQSSVVLGGWENSSNAENSVAMGYGSVANGFSTLAIGVLNDSIVAAQSILGQWPCGIPQNTPLFIVGNGGMDQGCDFPYRHNAMVVQYDGRIGIGTNSPSGQFELSLDQGRKPSTSTWTITSDERLKIIDHKYTKGLKEILALDPISYHYRNLGNRKFEEKVLSQSNVGFSAQEVQKVFPECVSEDDDGYLNLNMHAIFIAQINAIKEQQKLIDKLTLQNEELIKRFEKLEQGKK